MGLSQLAAMNNSLDRSLYALEVNSCYGVVLCFKLLLASFSIHLRQNCFSLSGFHVCVKYMSDFLGANRRRNGICDVLQICCYPHVVEVQGLGLVSHLCSGLVRV